METLLAADAAVRGLVAESRAFDPKGRWRIPEDGAASQELGCRISAEIDRSFLLITSVEPLVLLRSRSRSETAGAATATDFSIRQIRLAILHIFAALI